MCSEYIDYMRDYKEFIENFQISDLDRASESESSDEHSRAGRDQQVEIFQPSKDGIVAVRNVGAGRGASHSGRPTAEENLLKYARQGLPRLTPDHRS